MATGGAAETFSRNLSNRPRPFSPEVLVNNRNDTGRESLRTKIKNLYGEEVLKKIKKLETLRKKKASLLCSLAFLLRCRDTGTVPRFLRHRHLFNTPQANRIYRRTENAMLRERIHYTRKELALNDQELFKLHLHLSSTLQRHDWEMLDGLTYNAFESCHASTSQRQRDKFERFASQNIRGRTLDSDRMDRMVVNLSNRQLTPHETSVLAKGEKFAVTPKTVPVEEIVASVEAGIRGLPRDQAD